MTKTRNHTALWKQRLSLLLVLVFCLLVSASEYFPVETKAEKSSVQHDEKSEKEAPGSSETYLNVAVDAVVPFAVGVASQVFHLIYEHISFEPPVLSGHSVSVPLNFPFWEILLERIISPNAP